MRPPGDVPLTSRVPPIGRLSSGGRRASRGGGAGAAATIIRGGDHVLTIGAFGAPAEPTVSISGVTVTDGLARSSPESIPLFGKAGV